MGFIRQRCEKLGISVPQSIRPLWGGLFLGHYRLLDFDVSWFARSLAILGLWMIFCWA